MFFGSRRLQASELGLEKDPGWLENRGRGQRLAY
jgi:hypothetical protein